MKLRNIATILCISGCLLLGFPTPIRAQEAIGLTVVPPTVRFSLAKNQIITKSFKLENRSSGDILCNVHVSDFIVNNTYGIPTFLPQAATNRFSASTWVQLQEQQGIIPAHGSKTFFYTISVPQNAGPGGHYISFLFHPVYAENNNSSSAKVNMEIAALVTLEIQGNITEQAMIDHFRVNPFQEYTPIVFSTSIKNIGNIDIQPIAKITIYNILGQIVAELPLDRYNIFPLSSRNYTNTYSNNFAFGRYEANLSGYYGKSQLRLLARTTFWIIPWRISIIICLALITLALSIILVKKRVRRPEQIATDLPEEK